MHTTADVLIIGAGLAGLAAGHELSARGKHVHILEKNPYIGGRTASWEEDGMLVESGLHRFLGFYTELPKLMEAAGINVDKALIWEDEIEIRVPDGGPTAVYGLALLYNTMQSLQGLVGQNDMLSPKDKALLIKFLLAGIGAYATDPETLDTKTVLDYANEHELSDEIIERALVPLTSGILFLPPSQYSALPFFGLLAQSVKRFRLGVAAFSGGMTEVLAEPIAQAIRNRGGRVETRAHVDKLIVKEGRVIGAMRGGIETYASHIILATSLKPAQDILTASSLTQGFESMLALQSMPAVTLQMEMEGPATEVDRTIFAPGTALACFAEQSRTTFKDVPGRLSIILTPPERFLERHKSDILAQTIAEAGRIGLELRRKVTNYRVITHPHDFYSLTCGSEKLRPLQSTAVPGLTLAGDYTKQEFFATMEGAVRSGLKAAEITLESLKAHHS